ncbi:MAG: 2-hydroxyacid dehydrogenase [Bacteroidales bacterium]|nr:2-hydroxyacid dehydrogenase [Bacteroidales bacterium]MDD3430625.1 2-hydroxyacid dehydrogenase [Bacteroidales bacterium]MDD4361223.1 2-hydroxyacid dehydrogenase [Bacteroidales bacterium]MDD4430061.1 2-hydroxyacid dehydrogenase [Bacteroidales bacterium]
MKVAVFSTKSYDREYLDKLNQERKHELVYFEASLKTETVRLAEHFEAVCVFVNDKIDKELIGKLQELGIKLIVLRCAGFNNVDIQAACEQKMTVLRVPAYSPNAVAEHALALIMTLNRKTHKAYNRVREGNFSIERLTGFDLNGKTIGVIGTGKIGCIFSKIMQGLGCKVIAFDKFPNRELQESNVEYLSLEEVFRLSDIISLHCPLTPETKHIINHNSLNMMKKGVMIINTSRGKLIDTDAAIQALKDGRIGYLGVDVYAQEENLFFKDLSEMVIVDDKISRLMTFPNVLITAHQAYFTDNALTQIAATTLKNLSDFEQGSIDPKNQVCIEMMK